MKIIGLKVEGVRLLKAFRMKFQDKGLTEIRGANKQGKSTVIDCLELLLRGNKMIKTDMVSHGKESATIVGQIDHWLITRVLKVGKQPSLEVRDIDTNLKLDTKPQEFLNSLINELTFNPLPFLEKSSDEKLHFIQDLTGLDLTDVDTDIDKAVQNRYDAGVLLKNLGSKPEVLEKVEPVSLSELLSSLGEEKSKKHDIALAQAKIFQLTQAKLQADEKVLKLEADLKLANTAKDQAVADLNSATAKAKKLPRSNTQEAQIAFDGAEEINEKHHAYVSSLTDHESWINAYNNHKALEVGVKNARQKKDNLLKTAKMPIKGLEIREDGLYFGETHCENWSDSEGYEIALNVCKAMKPELKAVFIDRGEIFDPDSLKALNKWAKDNDIQIGISIVDPDTKKSGDGVFYIVDGEVQ